MSDTGLTPASEQSKESRLAALYLVMIVAYADEEFSAEEREMLRAQVQALSASLDDQEEFQRFIASLPSQMSSPIWLENAMAKVQSDLVDPDARRGAFAMAIEIAKADGKIDLRETQALLEIADQLKIDPDFARARLKRVRQTPMEKLPDLDKTPWQSGLPEKP
jgi:tellurite resistance protein